MRAMINHVYKYVLAILILAVLIAFAYFDTLSKSGDLSQNYQVSQRLELAVKYAHRDEFSKALALLGELQEQEAADELSLQMLKAQVVREQGDFEQAVDILLRLSQDYPDRPEIYNNLAVALADAGAQQRALKALLRAFESDKIYAKVYQNLSDLSASLAKQKYWRALGIEKTESHDQEMQWLSYETLSGAAQ